MPLFMDVHHDVPEEIDAQAVAEAHMADVRTQDAYGAKYLNYWFDADARKIFCLVDAPDAEAANTVHRESHGLVAQEIHPVVQG
jgi:hypothetical protein